MLFNALFDTRDRFAEVKDPLAKQRQHGEQKRRRIFAVGFKCFQYVVPATSKIARVIEKERHS